MAFPEALLFRGYWDAALSGVESCMQAPHLNGSHGGYVADDLLEEVDQIGQQALEDDTHDSMSASTDAVSKLPQDIARGDYGA